MAIFKRGNIWHVRAQVGGVLIARTTKTSNERVAKQLEAKWISEVHAEVVVAGRRPLTVQKAIELFLESRRGTTGQSSAEQKLKPFLKFGSTMLHDVDPADIRKIALDMVENEKYSINTVNVSLVYWNAVQNFCTKSGYTAGKKVSRLKGGSNRVRFLTDEESDKLLKVLDPNSGAFREKKKARNNLDFTIALLHTGAREQEVAKLKMSQIDFDAGTITIHRSKGGTDTTLKMSQALLEVATRRAGGEYLFPERSKSRYNNGYLAKAAFRARIEHVSCHVFRHTFATRMLKAGMSLQEVGHLLGHRNLQSTMIYAHLVPGTAAERAAQILNS